VTSQPRVPMMAIERDECLELLASRRVGRVAVNLDDAAQPVVRPVHFAFDPVSQSIVFRSVPGTKLYALTHSTHAAFEVDAVDPDQHTGWSVVVHGVSEAVRDPVEIRRLERLADDDWFAESGAQWIRIRARTVTGRRLR